MNLSIVRPGTSGATGVQKTTLTPSGPVKENADMKATLKGLKLAALEGGASSTIFLPADGVKYDVWSFSYHTGIPKEMNIKNVKEGATVKGHITINISGHASGGRSEQLTEMVLDRLASAGHDLYRASAKNDALFRAVYEEVKKAGYANELTVKVDGLPEIKLSAEEIRNDADDADGDDVLKRVFAMENTYNVRVTLPDGQRLELRNVERNKPGTAEYSTKIPIEFPAMKGTTIIEAWPTGSAEVAGYVEARQYRMHIGKEHFYDEKKGIEAAEKYMDAHPEVRWASRANPPDTDEAAENQAADMKKYGVHETPYPYGDGF
jgi:hypothetical protein